MKLTRYTDYALRVLMHLAAEPDRLCSIAEIADAHLISRNHLMKVVQDLVRQGLVSTVRGRGGGLRLARTPEAIGVGEVVRATEGDCPLFDCVACRISGGCRLIGAVAKAQRAFFAALDGYTIADVAGGAPPV